MSLLAEDVYTYADGGGKAQAARAHAPRPRAGRDASWSASPAPTATSRPSRARRARQRRPGRLARDGEGNAVAVLSLDVADGLVTAVRIVADPDKLAHLHAS